MFIRYLIIFFFLLVGNAWGAPYTVCSSGCDEITIQAVFDNNDLAGDDVVEVRADTPGGTATFREQVTFGSNDHGTSGHQVTLQGRSGDTIIISGASDVTTSGWADQGSNVWRHAIGATEPLIVVFNGSTVGTEDATPDAQYEWTYTNPNLDVYATDDPDNGSYYTQIEAGQRSYGIVVSDVGATNGYVNIDNIIAEDCNVNGMIFYLYGASADMYACNVSDCISRYNRQNGFKHQGTPADGYTVRNSTITSCTALENGRNGFTASGHVDTITYSKCTADGNCWSYGAHGFSIGDNARTLSSWTNTVGTIYKATAGSDTITKVVDSTDKVILTHNNGNFATLAADEWDQDGTDLHVNVEEDPTTHSILGKTAESSNITWEYCVAKNSKEVGGAEGHGFAADGFSADAIMRYNQSYDNEGNGFNINKGTSPIVRNNISYGNSHEGFGYMFASSSGIFYGNDAYNNTGRGFHLYASATGVELYNNISFSNNYGFSGSTGASPTAHDYNCAYGNTTNNWDGVIFTKQTNDVESDPLFTDAANGDFTLQAASPCINAGTPNGSTPYSSAIKDMNENMITDDYGNCLFTFGSHLDIGAYESLGLNLDIRSKTIPKIIKKQKLLYH